MIADHAPGLAAGQRPHGQSVLLGLLVKRQHALDEIVDPARLH
jgi:hypothetical protein